MNPRIQALKEFIRQPHCWPGGYPKMLLLTDGQTLCPTCAKENYRLVSASTRHNSRDGWGVFGVDVHWEGEAIECAHCGKETESAYGVPENE